MVAAGGEGEGLEGESSQRGDDDGEATAGGDDAPGRDAGAATRRRRGGDGPGTTTETRAATGTGAAMEMASINRGTRAVLQWGNRGRNRGRMKFS